LVFDSLLLSPLSVILLAVGWQVTAPAAQIALHVIGSFYGVAYSVFFHSRYGQTLGKMATRIKVVDLSGRPIGIRQALWRDGPTILLCLATAAFGIRAALDGVNPLSFEFLAIIPPLLVYANMIWIMAEFLTMLTNRRRRAIHDWIASTLVVRTSLSTAPVAGTVPVTGPFA
jgi:uncharacterized RDD family membrane protein YckC